jgi:hypothetical protein
MISELHQNSRQLIALRQRAETHMKAKTVHEATDGPSQCRRSPAFGCECGVPTRICLCGYDRSLNRETRQYAVHHGVCLRQQQSSRGEHSPNSIAAENAPHALWRSAFGSGVFFIVIVAGQKSECLHALAHFSDRPAAPVNIKTTFFGGLKNDTRTVFQVTTFRFDTDEGAKIFKLRLGVSDE